MSKKADSKAFRVAVAALDAAYETNCPQEECLMGLIIAAAHIIADADSPLNALEMATYALALEVPLALKAHRVVRRKSSSSLQAH